MSSAGSVMAGSIHNVTLFKASDYSSDNKHHVLLAATGSVATIKLPLIAERLGLYENVSVRLLLTASAARFLQGQTHEQPSFQAIRQIRGVDGIYQDEDEWDSATGGWTRSTPILHIELRKWADVLLIAPLSADSMAKIACGFADNLLLSVVRAWDTRGIQPLMGSPLKRRIYLAPAMNEMMWDHPVTQKHLNVLRDEWGLENQDGNGWIHVILPVRKKLACGDEGIGAMEDWTVIVGILEKYLAADEAKRLILLH